MKEKVIVLRLPLEDSLRSPRGRKKNPNSKDYIPMTFRVNIQKLEKLRELSRRTGLTIQAVLEQAMDCAIRAYEKEHGTITSTSRKINIFE